MTYVNPGCKLVKVHKKYLYKQQNDLQMYDTEKHTLIDG